MISFIFSITIPDTQRLSQPTAIYTQQFLCYRRYRIQLAAGNLYIWSQRRHHYLLFFSLAAGLVTHIYLQDGWYAYLAPRHYCILMLSEWKDTHTTATIEKLHFDPEIPVPVTIPDKRRMQKRMCGKKSWSDGWKPGSLTWNRN